MILFNNSNYIEIYQKLTQIKNNSKTVSKKRYRKPSIRYWNIPVSFDIETTSTEQDGEPLAWMYEWTFAITEDLVIYGRNWNDFQCLSMILNDIFELNENQRIICFIHNLSFEFQFMRLYFKWYNVFANGSRHPIYAFNTDGIEFRCSATLSALPLSKVAENLTSHKIQKLKGDLDYSVLRDEFTPLTNEELAYCYNDVMILIYYIEEQMALYDNDISKIPLTNTGRVRKYYKDNCLKASKALTNKKCTNLGFYNKIHELTLSYTEYEMCKLAFRGGFTHANPLYVGMKLEDVSSYDLTSAYPSVMLYEQFPMSAPKHETIKTESYLLKLCKTHCVMWKATFKGLCMRDGVNDSYLSWINTKMQGVGVKYCNNGRITQADELTLYLTNIDYEIISKCYTWNIHEWSNVIIWEKGYLPTDFIKCMLKLYQDKTQLKGVSDKVIEYQMSKGMLNSSYGCMVQDPLKETEQYDNDNWTTARGDNNELINAYNQAQGRFNYYPWGLWITAYCRRLIWKAIIHCGIDYVYSDTDSVKLLNGDRYLNYFNQLNQAITIRVKDAMRFHGLDYSLAAPLTIKGVSKPIGVFDYEGVYDEFKTLGAKRYITRVGNEYAITVAGCGKRGVDYLISLGNPIDEFKQFVEIPASYTDKLTHTYIDNETNEWRIIGTNIYKIDSKSSIHLKPASYNMGFEQEFEEWLYNIQLNSEVR